MKSKQGMERLVMVAFYLMVAGVMILTMFSFAQRYAREEAFSKDILSKDLGLFVDALHAAPGSFYLDYNRPLASEKVEFRENRVYLDTFSGRYVSTEKLPELSFEKPKHLYFVKKGGGLTITDVPEKLPRTLDTVYCPDVETSGPLSEERIFVDPQFGGSEFGDISPHSEVKEADLALAMARGLVQQNPLAKHSMVLSRTDTLSTSESFSVLERRSAIGESTMVISIGTGFDPTSTSRQMIIAKVPAQTGGEEEREISKKSKKLACTMLNTLLAGVAVTERTIEEVNEWEAEGSEQLLFEGVPSVVLEVGNLNHPEGENFLNDPGLLGTLMYQGVTVYLS